MEIQEKAVLAPSGQETGKRDDLKVKKAATDRKKLEKACSDFEALFVYQMLKSMRQTVPKSGVSSQMSGRDTYEMILDQKVADGVVAKGGGIGLQKLLLREMDRIPGASGEKTRK